MKRDGLYPLKMNCNCKFKIICYNEVVVEVYKA
jgi:hypothetical protein